MKDNAFDYWFGNDPNLSSYVLRFQTSEGKIVGFAGLTNYSGSAQTFRLIHAILPEHFHTDLPRIVIKAAVDLGKKYGLTKLIVPISGSLSAPFDEVMKNRDLKPIIYVHNMILTNFESTYKPINHQGLT